uniref:Uncharacterized protein n=1 Tax=uncultured Chloroflexota bacterium TaxID=166587 RepID=H5SBH1_9CHLR|nr:hypothetical protein HGMM_F07C06C29 [uncultured Chloroflexota bacterium]
MSEFNLTFFPPEELAKLALPENTHILNMEARPYPDGRRVRLILEMTPFRVRPHIEILVTNAEGEEVASSSIIEPMSWKLEVTLHLRDGGGHNPYTMQARLFYPEGPEDAPQTVTFEALRTEA